MSLSNNWTYKLLVAVTLFLLFSSCQKTEVEADLILTGAKIWTGNEEQPYAEAMAVKGDSILAIGSIEAILKLQGKETEVTNMEGKFITPGFIDAHVHLIDAGFNLLSIQLRDAKSPEEFINRIKKYAQNAESGTWIIGGSWDHKNWGGEIPTMAWIDSVTTKNPVLLYRLDGHMALANGLAIKIAKINKETKDVEGGVIMRDEAGEPMGIFKDQATGLIIDKIPQPSTAQADKALTAAMNFAASKGITSVHEMWSPYAKGVYEKAMRNAHKNNTLITRISVKGGLINWKEVKESIKKEGEGDNWLKFDGVKGYVDGSLGSHTAAFNEPFTDRPDEQGIFIQTEEDLYNWISGADKAGLQVAIHAIGDRANGFILDTFERVAKENGARDRRFRIEHAQHLDADDVARFAALNVIPSMQPYHAIDDGRWAEKVIGAERIKTTYAFNSLFDANAKVVFGSDWPVAPAIPLEGIYAAVTRRTIDEENPDGWVPEQKITVEQALIAYTKNAAYASFEEEIKGTLEKGKLADFVVIDSDLTEIDPVKIREAKILKTYVGGKKVFDYDAE